MSIAQYCCKKSFASGKRREDMANINITSHGFNKEDIAHNGNKFLMGNGYLGVRGTLEEFTKENMCAINLAGVYDKVGEGWRESVNAPNPLYTIAYVNGKKLGALDAEPEEHMQCLDVARAIHKRRTVWSLPEGRVTLECERFASMAHQHIIGMKYSISADFDCDVQILTGIDGDVWDINGPHFVNLKVFADQDRVYVESVTGEKATKVITEQSVKSDFAAEREFVAEDKSAFEKISFRASACAVYSFEKLACVTTSIDQNPTDADVRMLDYAKEKQAHEGEWAKIWDVSYVNIDGDAEAEQALNYSIYHLNCIAPRNMKSMSIPARGLSGQVYKGAVFWDTEMFMVDYYLYTAPEIVKTLIMYRVDTLAGALEKARSYGFDGAFYAWESHEGGFDACSDYNIVDVFTKRPMRTFFKDKQVHISAAVVYAIEKYVRITGDDSVLKLGGAKMIYECAKFYRSLMLKYANRDFYEIHDVVGPDEYHERVNNNVYTNAMAAFVLETAARLGNYIGEDVSDFARLAKLIKKPNVDENGVVEQFDGYFGLEDCTVDEVRSRLLDPKEYWGGAYGVASHTKVIKQADVVAMLCMLPDKFSDEVKRTNLKYYEPRTEHGSSLSACMYSLLSCKVGEPDYAYPLFMKSAGVDLRKSGKEWAGLIYIGGTHPASEGGAWMVAIGGFAGMKIENGKISCSPCLPSGWNSMSFKINYGGEFYRVRVTRDDWSVDKI